MASHSVFSPQKHISISQWMPLFASALSLAFSAAIAPVAFAQSMPPAPPDRPGFGWQEQLNLTEEQQAQMEQIRQAARQQMDNILTAEQKAQLEAARSNGEDPHRGFRSLNLTEEQRTQMEAVRRATREQIDAILTPEQRQQMPQHPPGRFGRGGENPPDWLNLTEEQQAQMEQIRQAARQQMDNILTAEQKAQLEAARSNGEDPRWGFRSLNLTEEQRTQIQDVHRAAKEQMDAILTPEQRQQMEQHRPDRFPEGGQPPQ